MTDVDRRRICPECATPCDDPPDSFRLASLAIACLFSGLGLLVLVFQLAIRLGLI